MLSLLTKTVFTIAAAISQSTPQIVQIEEIPFRHEFRIESVEILDSGQGPIFGYQSNNMVFQAEAPFALYRGISNDDKLKLVLIIVEATMGCQYEYHTRSPGTGRANGWIEGISTFDFGRSDVANDPYFEFTHYDEGFVKSSVPFQVEKFEVEDPYFSADVIVGQTNLRSWQGHGERTVNIDISGLSFVEINIPPAFGVTLIPFIEGRIFVIYFN